MRFKVGDRVSFDTNQGIIFGTVISLSIGWTPEKYYVEFKTSRLVYTTRWMEREELTLVIDKEKVIFT